jgi:sulfate adenylyltransferase subunit 1
VKEVIVAVNKMDLVDYSKKCIIKSNRLEALNAAQISKQNVSYIPSALTGDNVLEKNGCYALVQGTNDPRMT